VRFPRASAWSGGLRSISSKHSDRSPSGVPVGNVMHGQLPHALRHRPHHVEVRISVRKDAHVRCAVQSAIHVVDLAGGLLDDVPADVADSYSLLDGKIIGPPAALDPIGNPRLPRLRSQGLWRLPRLDLRGHCRHGSTSAQRSSSSRTNSTEFRSELDLRAVWVAKEWPCAISGVLGGIGRAGQLRQSAVPQRPNLRDRFRLSLGSCQGIAEPYGKFRKLTGLRATFRSPAR
jgi:hypothetical protein